MVLSLDMGKLRTPWSLSGSRYRPCSENRCPKHWTWVWVNCNFSLATLCSFKAKSFGKWMLSFCERTWEGKQRSKSCTYYLKVEPLGNCVLSIFQDLEEIRTLSKTLRHYCPRDFLPKWKQRYWLASSSGIPRNIQEKTISIKNLLPVWMDITNNRMSRENSVQCSQVLNKPLPSVLGFSHW